MPIKEERIAEVENAFRVAIGTLRALRSNSVTTSEAAHYAVKAMEAFWDAYEPEAPTTYVGEKGYPYNPMEGK